MSPWLSDLLLRTQSDERLVTQARLGNQRAEEMIIARYRDALLVYARHLTPDRAEDLVQQTFLQAVSALRSGTQVRHLRGWLHEILRNQACREPASAGTGRLEDVDAVTEPAHQVAERRMLARDALVAMAALPDRQQDALVQTAIQGRSRSEVANEMGLSEGAVRQLVHRARAALRGSVTGVIPAPLLRWLSGPRSGSAPGLSEAALGAGTASGAGLALKVGVGAVVASGILAAGVISGVTGHTGRRHAITERAGTPAPRTGSAAGSRGHSPGSSGPVLLASRGIAATQSGGQAGSGGSGQRVLPVGRPVSADALPSSGNRSRGPTSARWGLGQGAGGGSPRGSDGGQGPSGGGATGSGQAGSDGGPSGASGSGSGGRHDGGGTSSGGRDGGGTSTSGGDGGGTSTAGGTSGGGGGMSSGGGDGGQTASAGSDGGGTSQPGSGGGMDGGGSSSAFSGTSTDG